MVCMLIPKSIQTLFGNGDSPYGNIRLSLPISVRGLTIWKWGAYFWRPPSHALKSIFPQILDRKSKFSWKSPFPYGDPRFHIGSWMKQFPVSIWWSPYGNGDLHIPWKSPFPYGDPPFHIGSWMKRFPVSIWWLPYGNGDRNIPIWKGWIPVSI